MLKIFLDLSKAFGTIDLSILISILNQSVFNLEASPLEWFKSYLNIRKQQVQINDVIFN